MVLSAFTGTGLRQPSCDYTPEMGISGLPPELIALVVDTLHDDRAALRACALASSIFLPHCRAHLFERVELRSFGDPYHGCHLPENVHTMRTCISSDPDNVLSYTRNLSMLLGPMNEPQHLEGIYDYLMAFQNVRELQTRLFATHFVGRGPTLLSRYFSHFQPTLRRLHLKTCLKNPKDLITFIAFFPLLEEVSIDATLPFPHPLPNNNPEFDPDLLSPLKGSLRLRRFQRENGFMMELAKVRVQYHTLSICGITVWTGIQELIIACAPTLRVLSIVHEYCELFPLLIAGV